ncbi:hypothetical protein [Thiospirillum jenense]|uniref:Uncharacterized protein n=1 Tax=Thiospirillum jenense TaxID=1653858 RepID=A0A839HG38_9GAMM|nr:hypothetical protein [Thiospirillum jenense]MBB1125302.1 hypothetical protein [Thiospirillum jenense]
MNLTFSDYPGRQERHLRRRHANPLFHWPLPQVTSAELHTAQQADHAESVAFQTAFRTLVERAAALPADAGSELVLAIKEELERHYEQVCGLPQSDLHQQHKLAIQRLIDVIMKAIWRTVGNDPIAHQELRDEEAARVIHYRLLEQPLIADLLYPDSPIQADDLLPSLLNATADEVTAAAEIFDGEQLELLVKTGEQLLTQLQSQDLDLTAATQRLAVLKLRLEQYEPRDSHIDSE